MQLINVFANPADNCKLLKLNPVKTISILLFISYKDLDNDELFEGFFLYLCQLNPPTSHFLRGVKLLDTLTITSPRHAKMSRRSIYY